MAPSLSTRSDSTASSDFHDSHLELYTTSSRKRRRLSVESSDEGVLRTAFPTKSRVRPRSKEREGGIEPGVVHTTVSNGKIVDAKSSFATLNVAPWLIASLAAMAIQRPTAIQKGCIPDILAGKDVIGGSRTGSGKTVAFAVPILQKWAEDPIAIYAVILTPTR